MEILHGEGSDYFVAQVLDNTSGRQVAVLHKQFDADEYTRQIYCLAKYYNDALVGIEANFDTFPIKYLEKLGYEKQFIRKREDNFTGKTNKSFGFKTDKITRPLILSELQAIVNDHVGLINDKTTLDEMLNFVKNEHGRAEAQKMITEEMTENIGADILHNFYISVISQKKFCTTAERNYLENSIKNL